MQKQEMRSALKSDQYMMGRMVGLLSLLLATSWVCPLAIPVLLERVIGILLMTHDTLFHLLPFGLGTRSVRRGGFGVLKEFRGRNYLVLLLPRLNTIPADARKLLSVTEEPPGMLCWEKA